jgi:hypothetical protein
MNSMREFLRGKTGLFLLALLLVFPLLVLNDIPLRDVLSRYAPMAQAILDHNWMEAFHPRVPLLFSVFGATCAGILHTSAFWGVKMASALCFALTVFPLWQIFRRVFDEKIAQGGCLLFIFCSYWLRNASEGTRESAKLLFLTMAALGLVRVLQERRSIKGYLLAGVSLGAMVLIRDDSLVVGLFFGMILLGLEIAGLKRFPWRTCLVGALGAVVLLPGILINYVQTGYPVVSFRFVGVASKVMKQDAFGPFPRPFTRLQPGESGIPEGNLLSRPVKATDSGSHQASEGFSPVTDEVFLDFITSLLKGIYFLFAIPAIAVMILRVRQKEWTAAETLLFSLWAGHTLLIVLQIMIFDRYLYVSRRYLLPAAPLAFGWTALALQGAYGYFSGRYPVGKVRATGVVLCVLLGAGLYYEALIPQLKQRFRPKHADGRNALLVWSRKIREEYRGPDHQTDRIFRIASYSTFRRPLVVSDDLPELGFMAGGENCSICPERAQKEELHADYFAVGYDAAPPSYPGYRLVDVYKGKKYSYALYARNREVE